jgi:hypothetical protein
METYSDVLTEENRLLVLDDNSTYTDGVNDCHIVWLTEDGIEEMSDDVKIHNLKDGNTKWNISIKSLLDCWMEKYGSEVVESKINSNNG